VADLGKYAVKSLAMKIMLSGKTFRSATDGRLPRIVRARHRRVFIVSRGPFLLRGGWRSLFHRAEDVPSFLTLVERGRRMTCRGALIVGEDMHIRTSESCGKSALIFAPAETFETTMQKLSTERRRYPQNNVHKPA